jgi:hypothetical protein
LQEVSLPPKFCDDRVAVLQADARLLTPDVLQAYTTDVSGNQQIADIMIMQELCLCMCVFRRACYHDAVYVSAHWKQMSKMSIRCFNNCYICLLRTAGL